MPDMKYDARTGFTEELRLHIYKELYAMPPAQRQAARWVMNPEWLNEVRCLDDRGTGPFWVPGLQPSAVERLLGLPVEIRDDGGVPHLECNA